MAKTKPKKKSAAKAEASAHTLRPTVPGMLDTDDLFRRMMVNYHYRKDVMREIAAGGKHA